MKKLATYLCLSLLALLLALRSSYGQVALPAEITESNCKAKLVPDKTYTLFNQDVRFRFFFPRNGNNNQLSFAVTSNMFFVKVSKGGSITMTLDEADNPKKNNLDYILWGPYDNLTDPGTKVLDKPVDFVSSSTYPYNNGTSVQTFNLTPRTGQYYLLFVDNVDKLARTFKMTYASGDGGAIDTSPIGDTPTISGQPNAGAVCAGGTLSLAVTATNATSYQWRLNNNVISGATDATYTKTNFTNSNAGQYDVIVYGSTGCYALSNAITVNTTTGGVPSITSQPGGINTCTGQSATFNVTASGSNLTYQWRKNGAPISGATSASYSLAGVTTNDAGQYDVVISTACGTVTSSSATLTVQAAAVITSQPTAQQRCSGESATFQVVTSGSVTGYQWRKNGTPIEGAINATYSLANVTSDNAGQYDVLINGPCGTQNSSQASLTVRTPISIANQPASQAVCPGGSVTLQVTATGEITGYQWRKNGNPINGATASSLALSNLTNNDSGSYDVIVQGPCGTVTSSAATLTVPTDLQLTPTATSATCFQGSNGQASVVVSGGTSPYTYRWNTNATTAAIDGLTAGTYSVVVTDGIGCSKTASVAIGQPTQLVLATTSTAIKCAGGTDGSATVTATGGTAPYTYRWNNGATTATASGLIAGEYQVIVTDANGCQQQISAFISQPSPLVLTTTSTAIKCFGGSDGSATVTATGGTAPYTYRWSNGATTPTVSNLTASDYQLVVTDANGCQQTTSVAVAQPATLLTLTSANSPAKCFGSSDGSATVTATGGGTTYSYQWSTGATTPTTAGLAAGTYQVSVTDNNGCLKTTNVTIAQPTQLALTTTSTAVKCFGSNDGSATVTATGGTAPYTYRWNSGATTATASGLIAGEYQVTITDANGCQQATSLQVTQPTQLVLTTSSTAVKCFGGNDGTATVTATGGTAPYTYRWSNGATTATASGLIAGEYQVTVTDANGCTKTASVTVIQPTQLVLTTSTTAVKCFGGSDGSATVTATGGTAPYTYRWSNGATTPTVSNLTASDYQLVVTDANGCQQTTSVAVAQPATLLTLTSANSPAKCFGSSDGSATVTATGGGTTYSYQWSTGATTPTTAGLAAGTYQVSVTDNNGCLKTTNVTIAQPTQLALTTSATAVKCFGGNDGTATVTVTGGTAPYTYRWNNGATTATASGLIAGEYQITVTDANGCQQATSLQVTQPTQLVLTTSSTAVKCFGGIDGTATVTATGGTAPYTYRWSNGVTTPTANGLTAGPYSVTVTDANGCTKLIDVQVIQPTQLVLTTSATAAKCFGGNDGSATVTATGGTAPYTYRWSNGATIPTVSNLTAGPYSVTTTDGNGCAKTSTIDVAQPATLLTLTTSTTATKCFLSQDGKATVAVAGGGTSYTYQWSTGATTPTVEGLPAGTYSVQVTDNVGCVKTASTQISQPAVLVLTTANTAVKCFGGNDGTATVTASGGTAPYTYRWSNGATTASITSLTAGSYTVRISDANDCQQTVTVTVSQPTKVGLTLQKDDVKCFGGSDGAITSAPTGGTGAYSYAWSTGATTPTLNGLVTGAYQLTITDGNTCVQTAGIQVDQPTLVVLTSSSTPVKCFNGSDGVATVVATGGKGDYTYRWNNGATVAAASGLAAGTYSVNVADANGCTKTTSIDVTQPAAITLTPTITAANCFSSSDGSATIVATGGVGNYTYRWSTGATTPVLREVSAGTYSVVVSDGNSCVKTTSITVTQPTELILTIASTAVKCFDGTTGTATVTAVGSVGNYTYSWNTGATTSAIASLTAGTYQVTVSDANNCRQKASVEVKQPDQLRFTLQKENVNCFGGSDGTISLSAKGGTGAYQALVNGTATAFSAGEQHRITGLVPATYQLTVADANACQTTAQTALIEQPKQPVTVALTTATNPRGFGLTDGSISVAIAGGTPQYQTLWTAGAGGSAGAGQSTNGGTVNTITQIGDDTYTITVQDARYSAATQKEGCMATLTQRLTQPPKLTLTLTATQPVSCFGRRDARILATADGGVPLATADKYTIRWQQIAGGTTVPLNTEGLAIQNLPAGTYRCIIADKNGITQQADLVLTEPAKLVADATGITNNLCYNDQKGTATVQIQGGTSPYRVDWSTGATGISLTSLKAGRYLAIVSDQNGCSAEVPVRIQEPTALAVSVLDKLNPTCAGRCDGRIQTTAKGGVLPYTFSWNTGPATASLVNLCGGDYALTVRDANGCRVTTPTVALVTPASKTLSVSADRTICEGQTLQLNATQPGTNTYAWTLPNGTTSANPRQAIAQAGPYQITVTDSVGCSASNAFTVRVTPMTAQLTFIIASQGIVGDTIVAVNVSDGNAQFEWILPASARVLSKTSSLVTFICTQTGAYQIGLRGSNGTCEAEVYKTLTIKPESGRRAAPAEPTPTAVIVYPNPTAGQFRVQVDFGSVTTARLSVIDLRAGQSVYTTQLAGQSTYDQAIDLPDLPAGSYIVQISTATQQVTKRIIINR
ncbi:putative secreted protein (Por secretion system target) [Spirosoma oryzae]|uniref:Putative secreted protein (Por secretion system target) n=1 Tax=Spirosoma oryzae TaxID=1469603 RepID=A0A2T0T0J6_9BACT|nr:T9SS type A sorting domain-containing protein [Spirosoma oryzae]PRY39169.1 putative secreted protein (Por secretion system target) [Spirosoma oryzae]